MIAWAGLSGFRSANLKLMEKQMNLKRAFLILMVSMLLPSLAAAQEGQTARFIVDKIWVDTDLELNNISDEVKVEIVCNTGLPLRQEATISSGVGNGVVFVVEELIDIDLVECTISEIEGPNFGFRDWSVSNGEIPTDLALGGCLFTGGEGGNFLIQNECILVNQALPATFTVTTEWNVNDGTGDMVSQESDITIMCNEEIAGGIFNDEDDYWYFYDDLVGDDSVTVSVNTQTDGGAYCKAEDSVSSSSVDKISTCNGNFFLQPGGSSGCGFVYSVFFEGVPTLNQYGLAILALLMLGVGFVGFRRFV